MFGFDLTPDEVGQILLYGGLAIAAVLFVYWMSRSKLAAPRPTAAPRPAQPQAPAPQPVRQQAPPPTVQPPPAPPLAITAEPAGKPTTSGVPKTNTAVIAAGKLNLTPREIEEVSRDYGAEVDGETNMTDGRLLWSAALVLVSAAFSLFVGPRLVQFFWGNHQAMFSGALALWAGTLAFIAPRGKLVFVPKYTALQTTGMNGKMHHFGSGLKGLYPTDHFIKKDFIDMRLIVIEGLTIFLTSDGVPVQFRWTLQCRPVLALLGIFLRASVDSVSRGFAEVIESVLSVFILGMKIEQVRKPRKIDGLDNKVLAKLSKVKRGLLDSEGHIVSVHYGVRIEMFVLGPPTVDKSYGQALTAKALSGLINDAAKKFVDDLRVRGDVALDRALLIQKDDNVKATIQRLEVGQDTIDGIGKAVASVMAVFRKEG